MLCLSPILTPALRWRRPFAAFGSSRLKVGLDYLLHTIVGFYRRNDLGQFLSVDDHLDLCSVEHFALNQRQRNPDQHIAIRMKQVLGGVITALDQLLHFRIDLDRCGLAVVAMLRNLAAQEDLLFLLAEGEWSQVAHA